MKSNIKKIAYRAIPLVTAFVLLLSCVVVGNSLNANAIGIVDTFDYDNGALGSSAPFTPWVFSASAEPRDWCKIEYFGANRSQTYYWKSDDTGHLAADKSFSLFLPIKGEFTRSQMGNFIEVSGLQHFGYTNSYDGAWTSLDITIDYIFVHYYDVYGNWVGDQKIYRSNNVYADFLYWPSNAQYLTFELARCYEGGTSGAMIRFDLYDSYNDCSVFPSFISYNRSMSGSMYYGWPLGQVGYGSIYADLKTTSPHFIVTEYNGIFDKYLRQSFDAVEFIYWLDRSESLYIEYDPKVVFDVDEFLAVSAEVSVDELNCWVYGYGDGSANFTPPVFIINYLDSSGNLIQSQEVSCNCKTETWNGEHVYKVLFSYPENVKYLTFGLKWSVHADGEVAFLFGFDKFTMMFDRTLDSMEQYFDFVNPAWPDVDSPSGGGSGIELPSVDAGSVDIGALVDSEALQFFTSVIVQFWDCVTLNSMLLIVVSLCLVSWIFFGKKG